MSQKYQDFVDRIKDKQEVELTSSRLLPTIALLSITAVIYFIIRTFNSFVYGEYQFKYLDVIFLIIGIPLIMFLHNKFYVIKSKRGRIFANSSFKQYRIIPENIIEIKSVNEPPMTFFGLFRLITVEFKVDNKTIKILTWRKSNAFDERYKIRKIFEALKQND